MNILWDSCSTCHTLLWNLKTVHLSMMMFRSLGRKQVGLIQDCLIGQQFMCLSIMSITNETELSSAWSLGEPQKLMGEAC